MLLQFCDQPLLTAARQIQTQAQTRLYTEKELHVITLNQSIFDTSANLITNKHLIVIIPLYLYCII